MTNKACRSLKSASSNKTSCNASWTKVPTYSAVIAISGGESVWWLVWLLLTCIIRLVKEYEDPSLVPEYWVCTMNKVSRVDISRIRDIIYQLATDMESSLELSKSSSGVFLLFKYRGICNWKCCYVEEYCNGFNMYIT